MNNDGRLTSGEGGLNEAGNLQATAAGAGEFPLSERIYAGLLGQLGGSATTTAAPAVNDMSLRQVLLGQQTPQPHQAFPTAVSPNSRLLQSLEVQRLLVSTQATAAASDPAAQARRSLLASMANTPRIPTSTNDLVMQQLLQQLHQPPARSQDLTTTAALLGSTSLGGGQLGGLGTTSHQLLHHGLGGASSLNSLLSTSGANPGNQAQLGSALAALRGTQQQSDSSSGRLLSSLERSTTGDLSSSLQDLNSARRANLARLLQLKKQQQEQQQLQQVEASSPAAGVASVASNVASVASTQQQPLRAAARTTTTTAAAPTAAAAVRPFDLPLSSGMPSFPAAAANANRRHAAPAVALFGSQGVVRKNEEDGKPAATKTEGGSGLKPFGASAMASAAGDGGNKKKRPMMDSLLDNHQGLILGLIDSTAARSHTPEPAPGKKSKLATESATKTATAKKTAVRPPTKKRRVCAVSVQKSDTPHFSQRESASLGTDEDQNWLSEFQCFARAQMMEVFQADKADVVVRSTSKSVKLHQVGVRCRFCAHLPHSERVNRSSAFPSGLSKIYQSFNMMVRDHFAHCTEIPADITTEYLALKGKNSQGACDSRHYWYYAAQTLGMVDTDNRGGIEMTAESKAAAKSMPPYGTKMDGEEGAAASDDSAFAATEEDVALVQRPEDEARASPFLYGLLSHIQIVPLLAAERVGKRKTLPLGLKGFGCRYCFKVGRLGFSRCYPLRRRGLTAQIYDMHQHIQRCTLCPQAVKTQLALLLQKQNAEGEKEPAAPTNSKGKGNKSVAVCSISGADLLKETEFMDVVWSRLGRTTDLTT